MRILICFLPKSRENTLDIVKPMAVSREWNCKREIIVCWSERKLHLQMVVGGEAVSGTLIGMTEAPS